MNKKDKTDGLNQHIQGVVDTTTVKSNLPKVDSTQMRELLPLFKVEKDEFTKRSFYQHKNNGKSFSNSAYLYFSKLDGSISRLRLSVNYESEDWLFIKKALILVDSTTFEFYPQETKQDTGYGGIIYEWFDNELGEEHSRMIESMLNADKIKIKLLGRDLYDIYQVSPKQLKAIKETIRLYKSMGGEIN